MLLFNSYVGDYALLLVVVFLLSLLPQLVQILRLRRILACKGGKEERIDGMGYVVCEASIINAWYKATTGKYYVSSRFHRVLTRDELKAVLLHEEMHKKGGWIRRIAVSLISVI